MIYLTQTTFVSHLRSYDRPDGYEKRLPYRAILTISHLTPTTVYLSGAREGEGGIDRETWRAAMAKLKGQGVTTVMFERHGKMKTYNI